MIEVKSLLSDRDRAESIVVTITSESIDAVAEAHDQRIIDVLRSLSVLLSPADIDALDQAYRAREGVAVEVAVKRALGEGYRAGASDATLYVLAGQHE